jgi:hypothetical protein
MLPRLRQERPPTAMFGAKVGVARLALDTQSCGTANPRLFPRRARLEGGEPSH